MEHATLQLLYFKFIFSAKVYYRGVPGHATDYAFDAWCRGYITYILYVSPRIGNQLSMAVGL